jgi:hypothetical protein
MRTLLDALLAGLAGSRRRSKGVQADSASFAKLRLPRDATSSARHEGVLVFTFAPRRP